MVPEQKRAWFVLGVFAVTIVAFLVLLPILGARAWGMLGFFGFAGFTPLISKKRPPGQVAYDERDTSIAHKATEGGAISAYMATILICMTAWFVHQAQGAVTIEIHTLPVMVVVNTMVFMGVRSIVVLVLYGRENAHAE